MIVFFPSLNSEPQNVELRDLWTFFGHGMMTKGNKKRPEANALRRVCRWPPKKSNHYPTWWKHRKRKLIVDL